MKKYLKTDEWNIIEDSFQADRMRWSESIFSLGNGRFGQRGHFEEPYSSDSYRGAFVAGITFLDKTRVGWWKNGFPQFYTRIPNAPDWSSISLRLIDEELDLAQWDVDSFNRRLDMKAGISYRDAEVTSPRGNKLRLHVEHIANMAHPNLCLIKYSVTSVNYTGKVSLVPILDGDTANPVRHPDEKIWNILRSGTTSDCAYLWTQTRREDAQICYAMTYRFFKNNKETFANPIRIEKEKQAGFSVGTEVKPGDTVTLVKYIAIASSLYYERQDLIEASVAEARNAQSTGWDALEQEHRNAWQEIWDETDVSIEGDPEAQQGIRYNIFQLYQTYRGDDPRLNIGPKGFTGEKYGGNTYWNTELCCVPFFLLSTPKKIAENLLIYRYKQLPKAIENARKLGFDHGAALFPQVTSNGEECHSEWEITFEEVHRNNMIVYAILQHATLDYIAHYGLEVMIAVSRFWSQRVSFSQPKQKYVILGVTGPDEYENNVNNNWYTNYSCMRCLETTLSFLEIIARQYPDEYARICSITNLNYTEESERWRDIIERMYLPEDPERGIFIQNDGYMDKVLQSTDAIPAGERPINQYWSWDRILRSCYIKQSDVLLGLYLYYFNFDRETIRRNFDFYEPMTVHESSLSPCVHSILAASLGKLEKAQELYRRTARLDLDNINNDTCDGLHITSMAGSWLSIVQGFAGMRTLTGSLSFDPQLPDGWDGYAFKIVYRGRLIEVSVSREGTGLKLLSGEALTVMLHGHEVRLAPAEADA